MIPALPEEARPARGRRQNNIQRRTRVKKHPARGLVSAARMFAVGATGLWIAVAQGAGQNASAVFELPQVEVIGTTPLPGTGLTLDRVPGNVQVLSGKKIGAQQALDTSDLLNANLGSVNVNDTQGNPFQPDLNFRGFTASPVLGTPQGLSVFVDGVRVNEAFGDVVNWGLIPQRAIANLSLVPAANPAFGLGTLGGAITVNTKSGFQFPGTTLEVSGGPSYGRRDAAFESGGHGQKIDWYMTGNAFKESGWAEHNPSKLMQYFGKTGYQDDDLDIDLSYTYVDARLDGNQTLPVSWLDTPTQAYTYPDAQTDRLNFINLKGTYAIAKDILLSLNGHERLTNSGILNSNVNNDFDPAQPVGPGNQPTGNVINHIQESRPGGYLQLNLAQAVSGLRNDLSVGLNYESGSARFTQLHQEAGSDRDTRSSQPSTEQVHLNTDAADFGAYFTDNLGITRRIYLTLSGRYDHATSNLHDQLGTALNGHHSFSRFNPAAGLTYNPLRNLTLYASYGEGIRTPTPIELSCADPAAPCSLPNGFSGDPSLLPVTSKSWEAGARGSVNKHLKWVVSAFRSSLGNDIQFISAGGGTNAGYFSNVGKTRRQGGELGLDGEWGPWDLSLHYSYVLATFETPLLLNSPDNSSAAPLSCPTCSDIQVLPGDRIPGIPRHTGKLRLQYAFTTSFLVGLGAQLQSSQFARGDENNRDAAGPLAGYVLLNADFRYRLGAHWELFGKADNLLDSRYSTFGVLSQNVFTGPDRSFDPTGASWRSEQFRSVGTPIGGWLGLQYRFGERS